MCPRCRGLMVSERYWDGDRGGRHTYIHCLICGFYDDEIMTQNRNSMPLKVRTTWQAEKSCYPQRIRINGDVEAAEPALLE